MPKYSQCSKPVLVNIFHMATVQSSSKTRWNSKMKKPSSSLWIMVKTKKHAFLKEESCLQKFLKVTDL